jgi:hypothetical protein
MQTGQNSIAPANSLPQIEQTRRDSVFIGLTALFCCQKLDRLESIAFFGLFCIQLHKFFVSFSFMAVGTVIHIGEVVLE